MSHLNDATRRFVNAASNWMDWEPERLLAQKGTRRISVVIPARNVAATIGGIVTAIRHALIEQIALVDELVVIDSDSTDETAAIADAAGAQVWPAATVLPELGSNPGKGEALWKAQFVTTGDLLVFIDADLTKWGPHFVTGLVGPLLADPAVLLVKGFYDRVLDEDTGSSSPQGGRVTELVARPLLSLYWPDLRDVVQPLAGEWAIRRSTFAALPVPVGYGVEMSTLLDVWREHGPAAIAQVDLGTRGHSHQSVHDLAVMAGEIMAVAARRIGQCLPEHAELRQFDRMATPPWQSRPIPLAERPPARTITGDEIGIAR
jgi:glucosyl-3-phosphoglycerate synthase